MQQTGRFLSPAATQVALRSQWEAFQDGETIISGVRPEIAASWQRSAASRLGAALTAAPVDQAALRGFDSIPSHPSAGQQFMAAATHVADNLAAELEDAVAAVVVCDGFGVVLYRAGRPDALRRTDDVNLIPGGVWNERMAGTNGIGLALEVGGSAHVYAAEHYIEALHEFSCTAAIVRHPVTPGGPRRPRSGHRHKRLGGVHAPADRPGGARRRAGARERGVRTRARACWSSTCAAAPGGRVRFSPLTAAATR
jgi:hypothetical protein